LFSCNLPNHFILFDVYICCSFYQEASFINFYDSIQILSPQCCFPWPSKLLLVHLLYFLCSYFYLKNSFLPVYLFIVYLLFSNTTKCENMNLTHFFIARCPILSTVGQCLAPICQINDWMTGCMVIFPSMLLPLTVSSAYYQSQSKNMKWKFPEINIFKLYAILSSMMTSHANLASSYLAHESSTCPMYLYCIYYLLDSCSAAILIIRSTAEVLHYLC
jgi:hypothetical protein